MAKPRQSWRTQISYRINNPITLRNRTEIVWFDKKGGQPEQGFLTYFDVLYSYSIPVFYDKGLRYYLNCNVDLNRKITIWARLAQTVYKGKSLIGSGLDEIQGNKKTEIKLQGIYRF